MTHFSECRLNEEKLRLSISICCLNYIFIPLFIYFVLYVQFYIHQTASVCVSVCR